MGSQGGGRCRGRGGRGGSRIREGERRKKRKKRRMGSQGGGRKAEEDRAPQKAG